MKNLTLENIKLDVGSHSSPENGMCIMEAISYFQNEPFSDHPECVDPVLGAFMRRLNDNLSDSQRQQLKIFIPKLVGTVGNSTLSQKRAESLAYDAITIFAPFVLRKVRLIDAAEKLENQPFPKNADDWRELKNVANAAAYYAADAANAAAYYAADAAAYAAYAAYYYAAAIDSQEGLELVFKSLEKAIAIKE